MELVDRCGQSKARFVAFVVPIKCWQALFLRHFWHHDGIEHLPTFEIWQSLLGQWQTNWLRYLCTCEQLNYSYHTAGKFDRELNLVVWWSAWATTKLKSAKISYLHVYVWRFRNKLPNLNLPICLQWQFGTQQPNLISANISGYTVLETYSYNC